MNNTIYEAATLIVPLVFAIVFHEVAHGLSAKWLGDPTASERGRLSLNPLRHVDPVGTIIIPGMLALAHLPVFGWAKPVPVDPRRMRDPRKGMMLSAAAGPAMNLVMGLAAALVIGVIARLHPANVEPTAATRFVLESLAAFISINVFLAFFNLLPLPPFDGSHIVQGLLPAPLARRYARLRRLGFSLVLILLVVLPTLVPGFDIVGRLVGPPVSHMLDFYGAIADRIAGTT